MRKLFSYIGIFVLLVAYFVPVALVHGQTPAPTIPTTPVSSLPSTPSALSNVPTVAPPFQTGSSSSPQLKTGNWVTDYLAKALAWIAYEILQMVALVLGLAGVLLNYVLNYTVVDMAKHINDMTGINIGWKVIRDLMNIVFIFLLVYEGIKQIIGLDNNAKKIVFGVILASLLVNFSLFFTKVLIDTSNIVTIGFYNSIIGPDGASQGVGLSNTFQKAIGLGGVFDSRSLDGFQAGAGGTMEGILIVGVMGSILFIIETFVFFAISIMFIVRYLVLILLLTLSPIGYLGLANIPGVKSWSSKWWETLNGQLLFGPIYMIMTWVILTLMSSPGFTTIIESKATWSAFAGNDPQAINQAIGLLLNYILIIGLSIASVVIAKGQATKGAGEIGEFAGKMTAFAGGAVMGGTAAILRNTAGKLATNASNNQDLKDRAAAGNRGAQLQLAASRRLAESTFDVRRTAGGEALQKATKINFGKGLPFNDKAGVGGYKKKVETKIEEEKKYSDSLKATPEEVERINRLLDSKEFKEEEDKERAKEFGENSERAKKLDTAKQEQKNLADEAEKILKEAQTKQTEIKTGLTDAETKIKKLEADLKNTSNAGEQARLKKEIEDQRIAQTNLDTQLKAQTEIIKKQEEIKTSAEKETKRLETKFKYESESWLSERKEALIRQKGGQKREESKEINGVKYETQKEVLSSTQNYAETLLKEADKAEDAGRRLASVGQVVGGITGSMVGNNALGAVVGSFAGNVVGKRLASVVYGNTKVNRAAAAKIRGGRKQKSIEDTLKDFVAAESKPKEDEAKKEGGDGKPEEKKVA